jgi:formylglycine-generating enzyme required for sulfatase activity
VTRAQFSAFVFETGYRITAPCGAYDLATKTFVRPPGTSWLEPGFVQSDRDPVVCVSYDDAQAYIRWLTRKTKRLYRLPSEAEWEYAARAGTQTVRPWGEANICRHANVADRSAVAAGLEDTSATAFACSDGFTFTAPVASFAPNAFGLHDMLGNTAQWMADCLSPTYDGAPADAMPRAGAEDCRRVLRGGAWMTPPESIRSARRSSDPRDGRGNGLSFRVARDLEPPADQAQDR